MASPKSSFPREYYRPATISSRSSRRRQHPPLLLWPLIPCTSNVTKKYFFFCLQSSAADGSRCLVTNRPCLHFLIERGDDGAGDPTMDDCRRAADGSRGAVHGAGADH